MTGDYKWDLLGPQMEDEIPRTKEYDGNGNF